MVLTDSLHTSHFGMLGLSPCEMLDRPLHRGGRSRSTGGRRPAPPSAFDASLKPRGPEAARRPCPKASSVGALARQAPGGRQRRPAPQCLFEGTREFAKAAKSVKATLPTAPAPQDELLGFSASFVTQLVAGVAETFEAEDEDGVRDVEMDLDDDSDVEADEAEAGGLRGGIFSALLEGAVSGGLLEALRDQAPAEQAAAEVVEDVSQSQLGVPADLLEDFDEVMSIGSEELSEEDQLEEEAASFVNMAMRCAHRAVQRGVEADVAAYAAEQALLESVEDVEADEDVEEPAPEPLPSPVAPARPFARLASVGSWAMPVPPKPFDDELPVQPAPAEEGPAPGAAPAAVATAAEVPFTSLPSVASWLRPPPRRRAAAPAAAPLASPRGEPVVFAPPAEAVEAAEVEGTMALALTPAPLVAAQLAAAAAALAAPKRTAPGDELPLPSHDDEGSDATCSPLASPVSSRASPLMGPSGSSRTRRRVFGAVIRPDSLKAELLEGDAASSPKSPASVARAAKVKKSSSSTRLRSPAGGLAPLKDSLAMFRMDYQDDAEEKAAPMGRQSSLANLYEALGRAEIHSFGDESGSEVERPRLRGLPARRQELAPLQLAAAPKGRPLPATALALDLGLAEDRAPTARLGRSSSLGALVTKERVMKPTSSGTGLLPQLAAPAKTRPAPWAAGATLAAPKPRLWAGRSVTGLA